MLRLSQVRGTAAWKMNSRNGSSGIEWPNDIALSTALVCKHETACRSDANPPLSEAKERLEFSKIAAQQ
jgi:hypothetical protein